MSPKHIPYPHTLSFEQYHKEKVNDRYRQLLNGLSPTVPVRARYRGTVKLHGTNATLVFRDNNLTDPVFQSRNRVISPTTGDNVGTAAFLSNVGVEKLVQKVLDIRGSNTFELIIIAGEFAGSNIQKGVALTAMEKFFCIFNIFIDGAWMDMGRFGDVHLPELRVFNIVNFKSFEVEIDLDGDPTGVHQEMMQYTDEVARQCPFGSAFGMAGDGEGIVWSLIPEHGTAGQVELQNFKTKAQAFNVASRAPKLRPGTAGPHLALAFVDYALTERRQEQGLEYMQEMGFDTVKKNLRDFVEWVIGDILREEGEVLKDMGADERAVKTVVWKRCSLYWMKRCLTDGVET